MDNNQLIIKLTKLWYTLLVDHHKDKDCHFYINKVYSYGELPIYSVEHWGYIIGDFESEEFNTLEEAEQYLIKQLCYYIDKEIKIWLHNDNNFDIIPKSFWENKLKQLENIKCLII